MEELTDITIKCVDCEEDFTFSNGEQAYFQSKSLSQPKRCLPCRKKRKATLVPDTGRIKDGTTCYRIQ